MGLFQDIGICSRVFAVPAERSALTIYSEGRMDWPHLGPIVEELLARGCPLLYLTSDMQDPGFALDPGLVTAIFIGSGNARETVFRKIRARVMLMTVPDLGVSCLARSRWPVHYIYAFHALCSVHMVYPENSFDGYDTVLCAGPHHVAELQESWQRRGIRPAALVPQGYCRLDTLMQMRQTRPPGRPARILVAPGWGPQKILDSCAFPLLESLLAEGHQVVLRPHAMSMRQMGPEIAALAGAFEANPDFRLDTDTGASASLRDADLLVTDWSGISVEYAFAFARPVLFIDLPPKVRNPDFRQSPHTPLEMLLRPELGTILPPQAASEAGRVATRLLAEAPDRSQAMAALRDRWVFNPGRAAAVAADAILARLKAG